MGYQVTARKWRPQTFDDVVEQQHVTRTLRNAIRLGRVAHAYLFAGTRGVGKTTMARVLAKALNCEQGPTEHPCNTCHACLEITQGTSLDIVEIDGASNRGIDEIRDLRERLRYLPSRSRYKVYIIDEIHMLTKEAFNALLKTLEEPPPHVVFVFATTELDKIPYTIVSRCQRFEFKRVSLAGIADQLEHIVQSEGITISRSSLLRIAKAAEGSMRDAQSLLDQVVAYCGLEVHDEDVSQILGDVGGETLASCLHALFHQDAATALHTASLLQAQGHEAVGIARALLEGLRHLIILKTTSHPEELIPLSEADLTALRAVAETAGVEEIYGHFHVLSASESALRHASNPFLVLEMTLVRMACIGHVPSLQSILEQLHPQASPAAAPGSMPPPRDLTPSRPSSAIFEAKPPRDLRQAEGQFPRREPRDSSPRETVPVAVALQTSEATPEPVGSGAGDFWEALQERVAQRHPSLAAFLQPGCVLTQNEHKLVIGFAKQHSFCRENVSEPENLVVVREAVQALVGRPLQVVIEALPEANSQGNGAHAAGSGGRETSTTEEVLRRKNEFKQAVVDIFNATPV